jgi:hypothetical protein
VTTARTWIAAMAWVGLLFGDLGGAVAQDRGTANAPYLRVEWELESTRGNYRNACGRVYNDREVPARRVMIMFEGFDSSGQQVSRRFGEVVGDVPSGGYSIFCLMVRGGAATYKVTVPAVEWGFNAGQ